MDYNYMLLIFAELSGAVIRLWSNYFRLFQLIVAVCVPWLKGGGGGVRHLITKYSRLLLWLSSSMSHNSLLRLSTVFYSSWTVPVKKNGTL